MKPPESEKPKSAEEIFEELERTIPYNVQYFTIESIENDLPDILENKRVNLKVNLGHDYGGLAVILSVEGTKPLQFGLNFPEGKKYKNTVGDEIELHVNEIFRIKEDLRDYIFDPETHESLKAFRLIEKLFEESKRLSLSKKAPLTNRLRHWYHNELLRFLRGERKK